MLSIKIKGEPLDLNPGTALEIEQENPFLQFGNEVRGDFSLPFQVAATPKNLRLLNWPAVIQKRIDNRGMDCQIFDNELQHSIGKIKIEDASINRNQLNKSGVSCFYLSGVANFFQDIKDIYLTQVDLGGDRNFTSNNTYNPNELGTWWYHIHQVLNGNVNSFDYAFFPVLNNAWVGERTQTTIINNLMVKDDVVQFDNRTTDRLDGNVIIPFPYLHYVLRQTAKHVGWRVEGEILEDADFQKIVMLNLFAVDWAYYVPNKTDLFNTAWTKQNVTINLQNHVPFISISEFLIALKNRFGWWYDFDRKNKIIRIKQLANVVSTRVKDFTNQATPLINKKTQSNGKIFSLKNEFSGGGQERPDLTNVQYKGEVNSRGNLPAPSSDISAHVYQVRDINNFYVCRQIDETDNWEWNLFAYNIFDVEPEGSTDEITTKATAVGNDWADAFGIWCPRLDQMGIWPDRTTADSEFGLHLVMYHGWQPSYLNRNYPFATSGIYNYLGQQVSQWSVSFSAKRFDGVDVGLYARNWQKVLQTLSTPEIFEFQLNLTMPEFLQLQFSDSIVVDGVKMFLSKIKSTVPFTGIVLVETYRTG